MASAGTVFIMISIFGLLFVMFTGFFYLFFRRFVFPDIERIVPISSKHVLDTDGIYGENLFDSLKVQSRIAYIANHEGLDDDVFRNSKMNEMLNRENMKVREKEAETLRIKDEEARKKLYKEKWKQNKKRYKDLAAELGVSPREPPKSKKNSRNEKEYEEWDNWRKQIMPRILQKRKQALQDERVREEITGKKTVQGAVKSKQPKKKRNTKTKPRPGKQRQKMSKRRQTNR